MEAKVLELLLLQLEQLEPTGHTSIPLRLSAYDKNQLFYVKELLSQQLVTPPSLHELSKMAGINEFKLKKGFKQLFGTTVFGFMHDLRMEHARQLLLEYKQTVAEVASAVGYGHAHHFTAAFKKKFSELPGALNKLGS